MGEGGPAKAGADEGPGSVFTACGKRTSVAAPHQSKIGDFCQLLPREKLILNGPGQKAFSAAVDGKTFPLGGRWPGEAGSDEGPGSVFTTSGEKTNVAAPHQSKIGDFCQLLPREKPNGNGPGQKSFLSGGGRKKTFPWGERWLAAGETDEERRNLPKRMHQNKTHPQSISTPLGSPYGRIWRFLRRAGACPRRSGAFPIARP